VALVRLDKATTAVKAVIIQIAIPQAAAVAVAAVVHPLLVNKVKETELMRLVALAAMVLLHQFLGHP